MSAEPTGIIRWSQQSGNKSRQDDRMKERAMRRVKELHRKESRQGFQLASRRGLVLRDGR